MNTMIKQRLKTTILERRMANGLGKITDDSKQGKQTQMTEREKRMRETRQESNRRSAKKARLKFEEYVIQGKEALQEENARNEELNTRLINLETHKKDIIDRLQEIGVDDNDIAKVIRDQFNVDNQNNIENPTNNHEIRWTVTVLDSENITATGIDANIEPHLISESETVLIDRDCSNEKAAVGLSIDRNNNYLI